MTARYLLALFDTAYVLALAAWVGSLLFVLFVVDPLSLRVLGAEAGIRFLRALLPRAYSWGAIAGAIALPAFVAVPLCYPEFRGPWVGVQAMVLLGGVLMMLYAGNSLEPAIRQACAAGTSEHGHCPRLRRRALVVNTIVLLAGSGQLAAFAMRPAPSTSGIRELDPADRGRFSADLDHVIEDIETKYGYRGPGTGRPAQTAAAGSTVAPDMVREIDTYYRLKRDRDLARRAASGSGKQGPETANKDEPERKTGEH